MSRPTKSPGDPIDKEDCDLIIEDDAYDLFLIERASGIFADYIYEGNRLEELVENLIRQHERQDIHLVAVETLPYYVNPQKIPRSKLTEYINEGASDLRSPRYEQLIAQMRQNINPSARINVIMVAVDIGGAGGHYGILLYYPSDNTAELFDSMQRETKGGFYTAYFRQVSTDILKNTRIIIPSCIDESISFQPTGGFPENIAPYLEKYATGARGERLKLIRRIQEQDIHSQNHFCYMYAIWYLDLRIHNYTMEDAIRHIRENNLISLVIIKSYIYALVRWFSMKLPDHNFFEQHFPYIWNNDTPYSPNFKRYYIDMIYGSDPLTTSLQKHILTPMPKTPIPPQVMQMCAQYS